MVMITYELLLLYYSYYYYYLQLLCPVPGFTYTVSNTKTYRIAIIIPIL